MSHAWKQRIQRNFESSNVPCNADKLNNRTNAQNATNYKYYEQLQIPNTSANNIRKLRKTNRREQWTAERYTAKHRSRDDDDDDGDDDDDDRKSDEIEKRYEKWKYAMEHGVTRFCKREKLKIQDSWWWWWSPIDQSVNQSREKEN